jgi:hypothetical protein
LKEGNNLQVKIYLKSGNVLEFKTTEITSTITLDGNVERLEWVKLKDEWFLHDINPQQIEAIMVKH